MAYQLQPVTLANALILAIALGLLWYGLVRYRAQRHRRELLAFVCFVTTMCLWQLTSVAAGVVTSLGLKIVAVAVFTAVVGPSFVYTFCWFVLEYTDNGQLVNRWTVSVAVLHVLLATLGFLLDVGFMYEYQGLATAGPVRVAGVTFERWVTLTYSPTAWFWVGQTVAYAVTVFSGVVLARYMLRNREDISLGQAVALGLGIVVPLLSELAQLTGLVPFEFGLTDVAIGVTGVAFGVAVFRYRLLRIAPVGRKQVLEEIVDPVVLVDDGGRVVDANRAARRLVDAEADWRGVDAGMFFEPVPALADHVSDPASVETEIGVDVDGATRHFDLHVSPIEGANEARSGHVVVMREVTPLKEREAELDLMRQIQSRVLRHNIRNDLQTVRLYSEYLADSLDDESGEMAGKILATTDGLLSVSEKTRITEQLIEGDQTPVSIDLSATLRNLVERYRAAFPQVTFELSTPEQCHVRTIPAMEFALENLVENAAQHNEGETRRVDVTVTEDDGETVVSVVDDGPGIPEQELAVVRSGEETALEHGTGVGLWVVQWVVDNAAATVSYETSEAGTVAAIRFHDE